jgi:hypothetical protein
VDPWLSGFSHRALAAGVLSLLLGGAGTLHARLGETEEELVQRLGSIELREPEQIVEQQQSFVVGETLHFAAGAWSVVALMIDGRCERIAYQRASAWTDEHFTMLLDANCGGASWHELRNRAPKTQQRAWRRDDGVTATWNALAGFVVSSPKYEKTRATIRETARRTSARLASS